MSNLHDGPVCLISTLCSTLWQGKTDRYIADYELQALSTLVTTSPVLKAVVTLAADVAPGAKLTLRMLFTEGIYPGTCHLQRLKALVGHELLHSMHTPTCVCMSTCLQLHVSVSSIAEIFMRPLPAHSHGVDMVLLIE